MQVCYSTCFHLTALGDSPFMKSSLKFEIKMQEFIKADIAILRTSPGGLWTAVDIFFPTKFISYLTFPDV